MTTIQYLVDTSALVRILRDKEARRRWTQQVTAGLVAVCPIVELEFLYTARSSGDRDELVELLRGAYGSLVMPERVFDRAFDVQDLLTRCGGHRSAGVTDLLIAATAELHGVTLLHDDHDFDQIAGVTRQPVHWLAPAGTLS